MKSLLAGVAVGALALVGCTSTTQDLEGIEAVEPDKIVVVQNADQFPNVSIICIDGIALATNTRATDSMVQLSAERWCADT